MVLTLHSRLAIFVALTALIFAAETSYGQTIINVPPGPAPRVARDGEIVNVLPDGFLSGGFDALEGSEVNLLGGVIGSNFDAKSGSQVNILSGYVEDDFVVFENASANISGAVLDEILVARTGRLDLSGGALGALQLDGDSVAVLSGFDFKLDGTPIPGFDTVGAQRVYNVPHGRHLSGIFADGTPFVLSGDRLATGSLTLTRSEDVPAPARTFQLPGDEPPLGLRDRQKLIIDGADTRLPNNFVAGEGSELEVIDGHIGSRLKAIGAVVTVRGGNVSGDFRAFHGSTVNIEGGVVGNIWRAFDDSVVNISGGQAFDFRPQDNAVVNITGGQVNVVHATDNVVVNVSGGYMDGSFNLNSGVTARIAGGNFVRDLNAQGASLTISGGAFGDDLRIYDGSTATFQGFDFRINDVPVADLANVGDATSIQLEKNDFFTGVFADGTPFAFTNLEQDELYHDRIRLEQTAEPVNTPALINVPTDAAPLGIRGGQTLVLHDGGVLPENFNAGRGSTVQIEGGTVGLNLEAVDADVIVNGGVGHRRLGLFSGSTLTVNGGEVGPLLRAYQDSSVTVNGGRVFDSAEAFAGSTWQVNGGIVDSVTVYGTDFTITGGRAQDLRAWERSRVEITGGESNGVGIAGGSTLDVFDGNHESVGVGSESVGQIFGGRFHGASVSSGSVLELYGGNFNTFTDRVDGANLSYTGGVSARDSTLRIFGGAYGDEVDWIDSIIEIYGTDFKIDGQTVPGLAQPGDSVEVDLSTGNHFTAYLSGVLSDGTPLAFFNEQVGLSQLVNSTVRLIHRTPPAVENALVTVSSGQGPLGARSGQTVILEDGGFLDDNFTAAAGSVVFIRGGEVYQNFDVAGGELNIESGHVGDRLGVLPGGTANITGGTVGRDPAVYAGGVLNLDGGTLTHRGTAQGGTFNLKSGTAESDFDVTDGGVANISGGLLKGRLHVMEDSSANITGGHLRQGFRAESGGQVHMSGGIGEFDAFAGSMVTITGGILGASSVRAGGNVDISGGGLGDDLVNSSDGGLILRGQHFEIDGLPISALAQEGDEHVVTISDAQLFTGTLADGSPFVMSSDEGDRIGTVRLVRSADLPTVPIDIQVSGGQGPGGVYTGQRLTLMEGGTLPTNFNAGRDSTVTILGGSTGHNFEAYAAIVSVEGGTVGDEFGAFAESEVTISGGVVGSFAAYDGSVVNVSGGVMKSTTSTRNGSTLNVSGGQVTSLTAQNGSQIAWTGGAIASLNVNGSDSRLEVYGVDFRINGEALPELVDEGSSLQVDLSGSEILTGTLADGTPLVLGSLDPSRSSGIQNGTMTLFQSAVPEPLEPVFVQIDSPQAPFAVGLGQTLRLLDGGLLPANFIAGGGSRVGIEGGVIQPGFRGFDTEISLHDGEIGSNFLALQGAELVITGGRIDSGFHLFDGAHAEIRGGQITDSVQIDEGAIVDLFGRTFLLNDQPIPGLDKVGDVVTVFERGGELLSGVLEDGSELNWSLVPFPRRTHPFAIENGAILRLHFVPEPSTWLFALTALLTCSTLRRGAVPSML